MEAPSLSVWAWQQCKVLRLPDIGLQKTQIQYDLIKLHNMVADNKKTHWKNRVTHTILDIRPEFVLSAAILFSLKPSGKSTVYQIGELLVS